MGIVQCIPESCGSSGVLRIINNADYTWLVSGMQSTAYTLRYNVSAKAVYAVLAQSCHTQYVTTVPHEGLRIIRPTEIFTIGCRSGISSSKYSP